MGTPAAQVADRDQVSKAAQQTEDAKQACGGQRALEENVQAQQGGQRALKENVQAQQGLQAEEDGEVWDEGGEEEEEMAIDEEVDPAAQVLQPTKPEPSPSPQKPNANSKAEPVPCVPNLSDSSAPRPAPGQATLSKDAIRSRTRRIFTRRGNGQLKVSETIFEEWNKKGSKERKNLELIFQQCGYDPVPTRPNSGCHIHVYTPLMLNLAPLYGTTGAIYSYD